MRFKSLFFFQTGLKENQTFYKYFALENLWKQINEVKQNIWKQKKKKKVKARKHLKANI